MATRRARARDQISTPRDHAWAVGRSGSAGEEQDRRAAHEGEAEARYTQRVANSRAVIAGA